MVSAPKGVVMPSLKKALPDPMKGVGPMASAMKHHALLGAALKAGNVTKARHHVGHVFMALKGAPAGIQPSTTTPIQSAGSSSPAVPDSDGTNEGAESGGIASSAPPAVPAKPSMASTSAMFAKLRGK